MVIKRHLSAILQKSKFERMKTYFLSLVTERSQKYGCNKKPFMFFTLFLSLYVACMYLTICQLTCICHGCTEHTVKIILFWIRGTSHAQRRGGRTICDTLASSVPFSCCLREESLSCKDEGTEFKMDYSLLWFAYLGIYFLKWKALHQDSLNISP